MKILKPKILNLSISILTSMLIFFTCVIPCAATENDDTVTVAYIDYNNFIETEKDGSYSGYGIEYLNKISDYTGWNYKFVDLDWPTAYEAVRSGTVDFYFVARQNEGRQQSFDFSLYPICNEEMALYTLPESDLYYEDFNSFQGLKIGVLKGSGEINYLREYAKANSFDFQLVEYPMNNDVLKALKRGDVDAVTLVDYSITEPLKIIGNIGVSPAYAMSCEDSKLMDEFSKAQEQLYFDNPDFVDEIEQKYYSDSRFYSDIHLTKKEAKYIEKAGILSVALSKNMAPIEYFDAKHNKFRGVTVDIYKKISKLTGLKFKFVERRDSSDLVSRMETGKVHLTGAMAKSTAVEKNLHLNQTTAFSDSSFTIVAKDMKQLSDQSIVALPAGYPQFRTTAEQFGYSKFADYDSFDDCIQAVRNDDADLTFIISMCEGYLLDHVVYSDLQSMEIAQTSYGICFGVTRHEDGIILESIINKSFATITKEDINEIIVTNISEARPEQTIRDYISKNGVLYLIIFILILSVIAYAFIRNIKLKQQKEVNSKLQEHHDFLEHLYNTLPCGVIQYSYSSPHNIINCNQACMSIFGYNDANSIVGKRPEVFRKENEESFIKQFELCEKKGESIIYTGPITKANGDVAFIECVMDIVNTDQGLVFQEVFIDVSERINNEKQIAQRYSQELTRRNKVNKGFLYTACFDVDEQILYETDIDVPGIHDGITVSEFVAALQKEVKVLQSEETIADFHSRFKKERLYKEYEEGRYEQSFDLCRFFNGQIQWLKSDLVLRFNPTTGHLICFDYIWDVTDDRVSNEIIRRTAFADCEGFMSIYIPSGRCLQYKVNNDDGLKRTETFYGKNDALTNMSKRMKSDDANEFIKNIDLKAIALKLQSTSHYQVYATMRDEEGNRQDKALTFFYTNKENGVLAVTISDVTEVRASEVRHAQILSDALEAAEKADKAKSHFLSRVSHEMRTPLNAIIGFIELAKGADKEKMTNYLSSCGIAAKQLLDVINDVLDMSSIESGKMKITNASFNFKNLISSITNIYGTQCKQKGIQFETKIASPIEEWLVGDEFRINQILMNLLGNAIKFTTEGHIWLSISQTETEGDKVFVRFSIVDTGCGMGEQMMERLFKPFEQESSSTAKKYGGNGLGLSIVKNLVTLMEGNIRVESNQGQGSEFIVELPFMKSHVAEIPALPKAVDGLHILVIDDEESEREYISLILNRMNLRFACVGSGSEALKVLEESERKGDIYNVCIVDWRMPEMDGHDTTSYIRKKYGEDIVIIVVSAYDFQQAGNPAIEAGANLFLSKPIFQSSLFDLFMALTDGNVAKVKEKTEEWNFYGRRVLLVEDNELNQIVAKELLSNYNIVVDLAINGREAVDMFIKSQSGYYDGILMDIQMPEMDGFEATEAIRKSAHPDASKIQIIAQSADAFDEDISKALSAGMNSHIAKPIQPDILAKALHNAFSQESML